MCMSDLQAAKMLTSLFPTQVVQEAMEEAQAGHTSIVIAQQFSTIQGVDVVAMIQAGSTITGRNGHYCSLYHTNHHLPSKWLSYLIEFTIFLILQIALNLIHCVCIFIY